MINRIIRQKEYHWTNFILLFILINVLVVNIKLLVYTSEVMPRIHFGYIIGFSYLIHIYYIFNPLWYVTLSHDVKREVKQIFRL